MVCAGLVGLSTSPTTSQALASSIEVMTEVGDGEVEGEDVRRREEVGEQEKRETTRGKRRRENVVEENNERTKQWCWGRLTVDVEQQQSMKKEFSSYGSVLRLQYQTVETVTHMSGR